MKILVVSCALILAVTAMPTDFNGDYDPARQPGAFTTNPNYTSARIPFGQAGYASMNGGTYGGNGGAVWTVWDPWALRDAVAGNERREVYIRGRIDLTQLFTGSPGVRIQVGNFKSIYGVGNNAMLFGGGLSVRQVQQVIIQNLKIHNALSYAQGEMPDGSGGIISMVPGAWSTVDALGIEYHAEYVWVHHCEFADDPWIAHNIPNDMRRHDGLIDITQGANMISISNSIFRNHNLVSLVGNDDNMSSDRGRLKVTWYHNWFQNTVQRNPLVRYGEVHIVNNLYTDITSYGIGVWTGALIYAERNSFINTRRSWGWATTPNPNPMGFLFNDNNRLVNSATDSGIPSNGVTWRPSNYYGFAPLDPAQVESYVRTHAGPR